MESNTAAWMIAGGPHLENPHAQRDRDQLLALREGQRIAHEPGLGLVARLTRFVRPEPAQPHSVCCPA